MNKKYLFVGILSWIVSMALGSATILAEDKTGAMWDIVHTMGFIHCTVFCVVSIIFFILSTD